MVLAVGQQLSIDRVGPKSKKWTVEVAYAVTSLAAEQATAAEIADWVRSHYPTTGCTDLGMARWEVRGGR